MKKIKNLSSLTSLDEESEFQEILDRLLSESPEEVDAYKLRLPKHGSFWDDGYKDIRDIG